MKGTHEHNITEPHKSVSDWRLSTARVWPWENVATWSAISLLYTELDKKHSLTFLSGVSATHCLRLHSPISQYVGKILHTAGKILYLEYMGLKMFNCLASEQLGTWCFFLMCQMHAEISLEQSEIPISTIFLRTICEKHGKSKRDSTSNTLSYGLYYLQHLYLISQYFYVPFKIKTGSEEDEISCMHVFVKPLFMLYNGDIWMLRTASFNNKIKV